MVMSRRLLLVGFLLVPAAASPDAVTDSLLSLSHDLRREDRAEEALEIAREGLAAARVDSARTPWGVTDAALLVSTLERILALPVDQRAELGEAHRLVPILDEHIRRGEFASGESLATVQREIRERILGEDHPESLESVKYLAYFQHRQARFRQAERLVRRVLESQRKSLGEYHPEVANTYNVLGFALGGQEKYEEAEKVYRRALEIFRRCHGEQSLTVSAAYNNLAFTRMSLGDYEAAEDFYRRSLELRRSLDANEYEMARGYHNLAVVQIEKADYAAAERNLRESLEIRRRILEPDHPLLGQTLHNLGAVLVETGAYDEGQPMLEEALAIRRDRLGDHPDTANTMAALAALQANRGRYAEAMVLQREALEVRRRIQGPRSLAVASSAVSLGSLLRLQGSFGEAEPLLREALEIRLERLGPEHPRVGATRLALAALLRRGGRFDEAEPLVRESVRLYRETFGHENLRVARALQYLGILLYDQGRYAESADALNEAVSIARRSGEEPILVARMGVDLAWTQLRLGETETASETFEDSRLLLEEQLGPTHPRSISANRGLAEVHIVEGRWAEAEPHLIRAAEGFEVARRRAGTGWERATFMRSPYTRLAGLQLLLGKGEQAWESTERSHARTLTDLLVAADARPLTAGEFAQELRLRARLDELEARIDSTGMENEAELRQAEDEWFRFRESLSRKYPFTEGAVVTRERAQGALGPRSALVGWLETSLIEPAVWAWVLRSTGDVSWVRLPPDSTDAVRELRESLIAAGSWPYVVSESERISIRSRQTFAARLEPLLPHLENVDRLIVLPSADLLGLPLEALLEPSGKNVGERWVVSYVPSATAYTWLRERRSADERARPALLLGDPIFLSDELDALPGSRGEVERVAAAFDDVRVLLGPEASELELARLAESGALSSFGTLHFATHALVDDRRPELSSLALTSPDTTSAGGGDGFLTAQEIIRTWELEADLVTLSACRSGLGRRAGGEGYLGLAHAFLQSGAQSLLVSLWKVDDVATSLLMGRFYANLAGAQGTPLSRPAALQEAKGWLRDRDPSGAVSFAHPAYWSAFVLIGDPGG